MKEEYCSKFEDLENRLSKNISRSEYASYLFDKWNSDDSQH